MGQKVFSQNKDMWWLTWGAFLSSFWTWIPDLLVLPFFHIPGSPLQRLGPLLPVWHACAYESWLWSLSSCLFTCSLVPEIDVLSLPTRKWHLQSHWPSPRRRSWTSHPVPESDIPGLPLVSSVDFSILCSVTYNIYGKCINYLWNFYLTGEPKGGGTVHYGGEGMVAEVAW